MTTLDASLISPISEVMKSRNAFFDQLFYDVSKLTAAEKGDLSPAKDREGAIVLVPPIDSGRPIRHFLGVEQFLAEEGESIQAVAVAGVGSSVLGTAALARNAANAYGIDVAGIVSGYGVSDLFTEAVGGWFYYGLGDIVRHHVRESLALVHKLTAPKSTDAHNFSAARSPSRSYASDLNALTEILKSSPPNLKLLVGHSKGDLLIDTALERFAVANRDVEHPYFERLTIATFGAIADIPPRFARVHQFIGQIDWFGGLNSRFDIAHESIPSAWHHLNTKLPCHVDAESTLRKHVPIQ